jgi:hypothetical protein
VVPEVALNLSQGLSVCRRMLQGSGAVPFVVTDTCRTLVPFWGALNCDKSGESVTELTTFGGSIVRSTGIRTGADPDRVRKLAEPWRPYRSAAALFMWHYYAAALAKPAAPAAGLPV